MIPRVETLRTEKIGARLSILNNVCNVIFLRISGNAASNKNIHGTVSEQLKKNFAKSRWKVGVVLIL